MAADMTRGRFSVSVSKDYLTFSAAHFLTIPNHKCESLHGHNYVVTVVVEGPVDRATGHCPCSTFEASSTDRSRLTVPLLTS